MDSNRRGRYRFWLTFFLLCVGMCLATAALADVEINDTNFPDDNFSLNP